MTEEEEIFDTGISEEYYEFLNKGEKLETFQWEYFFRGMYDDWIDKQDIHTPFAYLQKFLFPIHSYSKRIECLRYLQAASLQVIDDEYSVKEWNDDFISYIRYNERLRELKERNIRPVPRFLSKVFWLDEAALLMQYISAQEMINFIANTELIRDQLSIKRKPKHFATFYSIIYRDNNSASVGIMPILTFCREFSSVEEYRCRIMMAHEEKVPIRPVPQNCRTACFNIYIDERVKHLKEEIMEHDKTRPYEPSELECLNIMYEQDKPFVDASDIIYNDEEVKLWLNNILHNSDLEEVSEWRCEQKIQQLNNAYGVPFRALSIDEVNDGVLDHLNHMILLLKCYLRLLEDRISNAKTTTSSIPQNNKPTQEDLENIFKYEYRQTSSYKNLIDTLITEKQKVGKNADANWRRHALVLYKAKTKIMRRDNSPHDFKEWLIQFCDIFGHNQVKYLEPGKISTSKTKSCIECYMP